MSETALPAALPRVVFFGMDGAFSAITLRALARAGLAPELVVLGVHAPKRPIVELLPARPSAIDRLLGRRAPSTDAATTRLATIAHGLGIDVLRTSDPGAPAARERIADAAPAALVVAGFHRLLSPEVLAIPLFGGLNLHPGRLPEERGPAPLFWALKAGRSRIGWAIHLLDSGEDSGDLLHTGELEFSPGLDGEAILGRCAEAAALPLIRAVRALIAGETARTPQPAEGRGRCPRPSFRDGLIDPRLSAEAVYTFVGGCARAYSLFAECGGDRFFIARAVSYDPSAEMAFEYALTGDRLLLRCTPGVVELELKPEGVVWSADQPAPPAA